MYFILCSFGVLWAGWPSSDAKSKIDPWLEDCHKTKQDIVLDELYYVEDRCRQSTRPPNMMEQIDLRDIIRKKAEKHSRYYRLLYTGNSEILDTKSEMAPRGASKPSTLQTTLCVRRHGEGNKHDKSKQRRVGIYEFTSESETHFKGVKAIREKYQAMVEQAHRGLKEIKLDSPPKDVYLIPPVSGYCSSSASAGSDEEKERSWYAANKGHSEVRRCASSDSAVGLTQSDEEVSHINSEIKDRNSFWITAKRKSDVTLPDQQYNPYSPRNSVDHTNVPSKTLIEAQYFPLPLNRKFSDCPSDIDSDKNNSRRQSCVTDDGDEQTQCRFWRTPSIVVSDYSDDVVGLTLEDIEYFRNQRKDNSSSPDSSLHSSCSNLNFCGSTISSLDTEYILRQPFRKGSDSSTCSTYSGDETDTEEKQYQLLKSKVSRLII